MRRTQISLGDEERLLLEQEQARTGRSLSALIRDAVRKAYGDVRSTEVDLTAMQDAFGSWAAREADGAEWVDRLRSGSRSAS